MSPRRLGLAMVAAVAAVAGLGFWDERREYAAALDDFAQEQATLAASVADDLRVRLGSGGPSESRSIPDLFGGASVVGRPNALAVVVEAPSGSLFMTDGREVLAPEVSTALRGGRATLRLTGAQATALGLPERTAMAGLAHVDVGARGHWGVAVVASAERQRDREKWARVRLVLATVVAAGLVVGFGGQALRRQRKEMELERELQVREVERERDERLSRLSKAATMVTLASGMAHEISTPLGVISGRAEQLLARFSGDERASRAARTILEQSQRVKDVVRGFLDLARGARPTLQDVVPSVLLDAAVVLVEHRLEKAGVVLRRRDETSLPPVRCDATLLEQAIVNLLLNACDASPRGGTVAVAARARGGELAIVVNDDGEGFADGDARRATEPFFTTKPRGRGTGLGLAIVDEIVKCHRGSFSIEARRPRGTSACIRLPLEGRAS